MALEKLAFDKNEIVKDFDRKIKIKAVPIGEPKVLDAKGDGNTWSPSGEQILKESSEGANAYTLSKNRGVSNPGYEYCFAVQYYKIK